MPGAPGYLASVPLVDLGLIRASGPEARSFLQNQLTNDAKLLTPTQGQLSGYCSPKGRLLAVFTMLQLGADDFGLTLPAALVAPTLKRLKMFVLRSKLTLTDASTELPTLGLMGTEAPAALARLGLAAGRKQDIADDVGPAVVHQVLGLEHARHQVVEVLHAAALPPGPHRPPAPCRCGPAASCVRPRRPTASTGASAARCR